jgi:tetratricopeptide (TPR) repeat protein
MSVRKPRNEHRVGRWAIWWPLALIAVLPGLTWLVTFDEPWKRSEKIAAVGVAASIAAAIAIYIGSRLGERRAATLATPGHDDGALEGRRQRSRNALAPQENRIRFNLPTIAASFTGREQELDEVNRALAVADRAVITQAISGLGGVGKSQLAARYAQQHAGDYDIVAWIRAEDGGIADLARLATKLGLAVAELSPSDRAQLAREWLGECKQRWLLVLDNIESPHQLEGLVPRVGSGRVVVTSRDRSLRQFGPVLTLDVFDEESAVAYLVDRAGRKGEECAARELARAMGYLPLALSHAGAYCQSGTSFTEYHELLGELPARELFDSNPELSYAQTVASTWKASIDAARAAAPLAADALELAAHLGPDAIPKSLFEVLVDADTARGRKRLADALNALARFSLATIDDDTVGVHRLLQKVVRDDVAARDDQTAALRALAAVADAFPSDVRPPACWPLCERLLPHALALADTLPESGESAPQLISLLNRAAWYLKHAEPGRRGLPVAQRALGYAERLLGVEHVAVLTARGNLAAAYRSAGSSGKAIAILEPLLCDCERILGAPHPQTFETRHSLVSAYRSGGRSGEAIAICQPLFADCERILGREHPETLRARNSLAGAYREAGRGSEAIAVCEPLLADRERILGAEHPDTLRTRNNLALAYQQAGRRAEAIAVYEPLVADRERILGAEHADTLMTRNHLVGAYHEAGRSDEAIAVCEPLLATHERILGPKHPRTLRTRGNLAAAYRNAARSGEAIAILEPLLADFERILGPEHPDTLSTRNNLATAFQAAGRAGEAIAIYEPLLADCERILGPEHPDTLSTRNNLATAYQTAGRSADADRVRKPAEATQA